MLYVFLPPQWLRDKDPSVNTPKQRETDDPQPLNAEGYGVYFYPNDASIVNNPRKFLDGADIDRFRYVFVDMDLKDYGSKDPDRVHDYPTKAAFLEALAKFPATPTSIIDSGRGIHAYWAVQDLDAMSFLRIQRRLARHLRTDPAVSKIKQVMRAPGTLNTKDPNNFIPCEVIGGDSALSYTAETLDSVLPQITPEDEVYCQDHWNKTYKVRPQLTVDDRIPVKFHKLLKSNGEVQRIWKGEVEDRSTADYRLGHILLAAQFTKDEAMSVLVNTAKALERAPVHRVNYAADIVTKVWDYEEKAEDFDPDDLSQSVQQILDGAKGALQGQRITCWSYLDNTKTGFRLGHVVGLVAGVKTGKTVLSLNMAKGFVAYNPDMDHIFVALEQPATEIASLWKKLCRDEAHLWKRLRVISNYNPDGSHRLLSLEDIEEYVIKYRQKTGRKVGCVIIDHIGALKQEGYDRFKPIEDICHRMKPFAIRTNTLLVMQSHAPREKAGGGDLELNQDAAYGTQRFEAYVDWLITMWQPLKKLYSNKACPKVTAFKFAAIRHREEGDVIQEGERYRMTFMPVTGGLREMLESEEKAFDHYNKLCANKRKQDRNTEVLSYTSARNDAKDHTGKDAPAA